MENAADAELRKAILAAVSALDAIEPHKHNKIDPTDPENAFTVWAVGDFRGPVFCGGRDSLQNALALAREHVNAKNLLIFSADPKHGLFRVPDDDRAKPQSQAHPGSGF